MRIGLAQLNTTVGDVDGNAAKALEWSGRAREAGCDLVIFPELTLPGYPAGDLYLQPHFARAGERVLGELAAAIEGIAALVGYAEPVPGADRGPGAHRDRPSAHNSLALLDGGRVEAVHRKLVLPAYGVFDEVRHFLPGGDPLVTQSSGPAGGIGLTICEDCWDGGAVARVEVAGGARLIVNASASPWYRGRGPEREEIFTDLAASLGRPIAMCNLVGAQDGLVFDGQSFVVDSRGEVIARAARFEEELLICEPCSGAISTSPPSVGGLDEVRDGLVSGLREYVNKNGFAGVVLGLSGGIDSALVATLAVEALGPDRVTCLVMPSPHSSEETQGDARRIARNLGARLIELPISAAMDSYRAILEPTAAGAPSGEAGLMKENIQARIRGNLVMAVSNREGLLPLSCGNKSEAAVGYATLYGDMAGGFAPIKDVAKTLVYELVEDFNRTGISSAPAAAPPVPRSVIERAPTAELRPGQRDTDSLPAYPELDRALEAHLERDLSFQEMIAEGIESSLAEQVIALVRGSEYKRRQSAPGTRVTPKDLDRDRRMPLTNRYRSDGP